ncbi:BTB/POZ domain-containing protein, partial [Acinetobacter baumannii]
QMSSILKNEQFSDFVIYCENVPINVHRNILSARAPYFQGMLTIGMIEASSGEAHLKDTNITALREMLHFLYSGVLRPVTLTVVYDLVELSDKYQI